jgi:hypothetical protein
METIIPADILPEERPLQMPENYNFSTRGVNWKRFKNYYILRTDAVWEKFKMYAYFYRLYKYVYIIFIYLFYSNIIGKMV